MLSGMGVVALINIAAALVLSAYALHQAALLVLFTRASRAAAGRKPEARLDEGELPRVTVQLPLFNERYVAERIIAAACALDWPADRLQIQVLDDSADDTRAIAQRAVRAARRRGVDIELVQREARDGYKAGALAHGLGQATGEFIAIFDADFLPPRDFLRRTLPAFDAPTVGFVQTRWGFMNRDDGPITRGQAAMLDMHFVTEQTARSAHRLVMNFNGSGGVWRRACIEDAGGWHPDCLSEDLDLSIRAEVRGWRGVYLNGVESPSELPPGVLAFKRQQTRWARGSAQVVRKLLPSMLRSALSPWAKALGALHISGYAIHLCILALAVSTPALALAGQAPPVWVSLISAVGMAPVLSMFAAHRWQGRRAADFARDLPWAIMLGIGLSVSNAAGLWRGFAGRDLGEFTRTPKLDGGEPGAGSYALRPDWTVWGEAALGAGSLIALAALLARGNAVAAASCALYAFSFGGVAMAQALEQLRAGAPGRRQIRRRAER